MASAVSSMGLTLECKQSCGDLTGELNSGSYYFLEKAEGDRWIAVSPLPQEYEVIWTAEAWNIPKDSVVVWTVDYDKKTYYAKFEITD